MVGRTERAVAAAVAVAAEEGLRGVVPVVLRDAWHVVVRLAPHPVVARVSAPAPGIEAGAIPRELAVAGHAAAAGAPVVPPSDRLDPGPHRRDGHVVGFWRLVEPHGEADPRAAGRGLRLVHDALASYTGALPATGHPDGLTEMIASLGETAEAALLRRAHGMRPEASGQALHGDAHLGNVLADAAGPLWHDLETACTGPREYDLAALTFLEHAEGDRPRERAALEAYGQHDADLLDAWLPVYGAWVAASMLTALPRRPELQPVVGRRLAWLRSRVSGA